MTTLKAAGNYVLIEPLSPPEISEGGILLPTAWAQPQNEGTVLSLGDRVDTHEGILKTGARVLFSWINRRVVEHGDREVWLIEARQILGVVE